MITAMFVLAILFLAGLIISWVEYQEEAEPTVFTIVTITGAGISLAILAIILFGLNA